MNTNLTFFDHIAQAKRWLFWKTMKDALLYAVLGFFSATTVITGLEKIHLIVIRKDAAFYFIIAGIALLVALIVAYSAKPRLERVLIDVDTRLKLKDMLSTAYEYAHAETSSAFRGLLTREAGRRLQNIKYRDMFPWRWSSAYGGLLALALLNIALLVVDRHVSLSSIWPSDRAENTSVVPVSTPKAPEKPDERPISPRENPAPTLPQKMRQLAKDLQEDSLTPQEFKSALTDLLQNVQSEQQRLIDQSLAGNESVTLDNMSLQSVPSQNFPTLRELRALERALQNALAQQFSEGAGEGEPNQELRQRLEDALNTQTNEFAAATDHAPGKESSSERENRASGQESDKRGSSTQRGTSQGQSENDQFQPETGEEGAEEGNSAAAGTGTAEDEEYAPSTPETTGRDVVRDNIAPKRHPEYNIHIRSITRIGDLTLPDAEIVRPYRQEVESVLQQEDIPLNYREYIRNYFISIGLQPPQGQEGTEQHDNNK